MLCVMSVGVLCCYECWCVVCYECWCVVCYECWCVVMSVGECWYVVCYECCMCCVMHRVLYIKCYILCNIIVLGVWTCMTQSLSHVTSAFVWTLSTVGFLGVQQRAVLCQRVFNGTTFPVDPHSLPISQRPAPSIRMCLSNQMW